MATTQDTMISDFPISKEITSGGELKSYINSDALSQAIKIWMVSGKGEKIRTNSAGVLLPYLGKIMDDNQAIAIKRAIQQGLQNDFTPVITVIELNVLADKDRNRWIITLVGYSADLSVGVNTYVVVSNRG